MSLIIPLPIAFLFGTAIGSFLNVVASRKPQGRSFCPNCKVKLRTADLIPILSYIYLKGRCRSCKKPISAQYPIVELLAGCVTLLIAATSQNLVIFFTSSLIAYILIILAIIDMRSMLLPDKWVLALSGVVVMQLLLTQKFSLIGIAVGSGFLGILWLLTRGQGIGLGDVKLMIPLGALFGPVSTTIILAGAFISGGAVSVFLLATKRASMKTAVPFGPFLIGMALLVLSLPTLSDAIKQYLVF